VRVALKNIQGIESVDVSLSKGEAVATLSAGNAVRYEQLLRAVEKNGFVVIGANVVVIGTVVVGKDAFELQVTGSNERLKLQPQDGNAATLKTMVGKSVQVTGSVPEVAKGKSADSIRCSAIEEKK
jgi:copper chaperone CopZ